MVRSCIHIKSGHDFDAHTQPLVTLDFQQHSTALFFLSYQTRTHAHTLKRSKQDQASWVSSMRMRSGLGGLTESLNGAILRKFSSPFLTTAHNWHRRFVWLDLIFCHLYQECSLQPSLAHWLDDASHHQGRLDHLVSPRGKSGEEALRAGFKGGRRGGEGARGDCWGWWLHYDYWRVMVFTSACSL